MKYLKLKLLSLFTLILLVGNLKAQTTLPKSTSEMYQGILITCNDKDEYINGTLYKTLLVKNEELVDEVYIPYGPNYNSVRAKIHKQITIFYRYKTFVDMKTKEEYKILIYVGDNGNTR